MQNCTVKHNWPKRLFDITFSFLVLTVGSPLFILVALLVKFSSKGHTVYSHERIGRGGKPFRCYKFRTMHADADQKLLDLLKNDETLRLEWETTRKLRCDPRVTPIGNFLRKTSLDELPQFWNVLTGDLSVVGPRPVVKAEIEKFYGPKAHKILSIRPGLTGMWQVTGRNDTSYETRVKLDEAYVEKHSLWMDLKLIFLTIPSMLFSRGAY